MLHVHDLYKQTVAVNNSYLATYVVICLPADMHVHVPYTDHGITMADTYG